MASLNELELLMSRAPLSEESNLVSSLKAKFKGSSVNYSKPGLATCLIFYFLSLVSNRIGKLK